MKFRWEEDLRPLIRPVVGDGRDAAWGVAIIGIFHAAWSLGVALIVGDLIAADRDGLRTDLILFAGLNAIGAGGLAALKWNERRYRRALADYEAAMAEAREGREAAKGRGATR